MLTDISQPVALTGSLLLNVNHSIIYNSEKSNKKLQEGFRNDDEPTRHDLERI